MKVPFGIHRGKTIEKMTTSELVEVIQATQRTDGRAYVAHVPYRTLIRFLDEAILELEARDLRAAAAKVMP